VESGGRLEELSDVNCNGNMESMEEMDMDAEVVNVARDVLTHYCQPDEFNGADVASNLTSGVSSSEGHTSVTAATASASFESVDCFSWFVSSVYCISVWTLASYLDNNPHSFCPQCLALLVPGVRCMGTINWGHTYCIGVQTIALHSQVPSRQ